MSVYASRVSRWGGVAFVGVVVVCVLDWLIVSHDNWAFGVLALLVLPILLRDSIGDLWHPRPVAYLNEEGLESDFGFEPWSNIADVDVRWCVHGGLADRGVAVRVARRLVLHLRLPDLEPRSPTRQYAQNNVSRVYGDRIEVPLWGSKSRVLADVRRASASYGFVAESTHARI